MESPSRPESSVSSFATYGATVSDPVVGFLNLELKTGNMKLIKTSEDGKVEGIRLIITGEGYNATKTTDFRGEIDISDLNLHANTVTEQAIDKYEPQQTQRVTIGSGPSRLDMLLYFGNILFGGFNPCAPACQTDEQPHALRNSHRLKYGQPHIRPMNFPPGQR